MKAKSVTAVRMEVAPALPGETTVNVRPVLVPLAVVPMRGGDAVPRSQTRPQSISASVPQAFGTLVGCNEFEREKAEHEESPVSERPPYRESLCA